MEKLMKCQKSVFHVYKKENSGFRNDEIDFRCVWNEVVAMKSVVVVT